MYPDRKSAPTGNQLQVLEKWPPVLQNVYRVGGGPGWEDDWDGPCTAPDRSGQCLFLAAPHSLCPWGFRDWLR